MHLSQGRNAAACCNGKTMEWTFILQSPSVGQSVWLGLKGWIAPFNPRSASPEGAVSAAHCKNGITVLHCFAPALFEILVTRFCSIKGVVKSVRKISDRNPKSCMCFYTWWVTECADILVCLKAVLAQDRAEDAAIYMPDMISFKMVRSQMIASDSMVLGELWFSFLVSIKILNVFWKIEDT